MNSRWLTIKQLDQQLKEWQTVSKKYGMPRAGWVKTVRLALSMSAEQLASRLGLTRSRITQLENAEIHDAVTLRTLREAANAMGCELVYAIVPKNQPSLENIIRKQAEQVAEERVARIAHSMSLEAQSVNTNILKKQKEDLTKNLIGHLNKKFWSTQETPEYYQDKNFIHNLAEAIRNHMQKMNETSNKSTKEILNNINNQEFENILKKYLSKTLDNQNIYDADTINKLNEPIFLNTLRKTITNLEKNNDSKKNYFLKKLIENLQKKK